MKLFFIMMFMEPDTKTGGFTPEEKAELKTAINDVQTALEGKQKSIVEAELKKHADTINDSIKKFADWQTQKDEADNANQKALDQLLVQVKELQKVDSTLGKVEAKSLFEAMADALKDKENIEGIASVGRGHRFKMMLKGPIDLSAGPKELYDFGTKHRMETGISTKTVGNMTAANNLTGQGFVDYGNRQVILPAQKVNARDLVRTIRSETGTYVYFRESAGEGSISRQTTHGAAKTQIDFDFARVESVQEYIAGWTKFAKQLMRQLPFLQQTLPRLLQREFFKVENRRFWDIMNTAAAAGGTASGSTETDDVKEIIDAIAALYDADYVASFGLISWKTLARINKYLLTNGNYLGSGSVVGNQDGQIRIMGTPILPATFVESHDVAMIYDQDYVERVEVESLAVEFFEQDDDNVQKNLITARIECMEEFNAMQPAAIVLEDLGNSSTS